MRATVPIWALVWLTTSGVSCQAEPVMRVATPQAAAVSVDSPPPSPPARETVPAATTATAAHAASAKQDWATSAETSTAEEARFDDVKSTGVYADNAFPPTVPDTQWHQKAWMEPDCLRCHETGVQEAPRVKHEDLPDILLTAKCRSCHVLIPGLAPRQRLSAPSEAASQFAAHAFPPMMPNSESHKAPWGKDDCLLCHESGIRQATIVEHEGLPGIYLKAKCRSCHVQIRAVEPGTPPQ